MQRNEVIDFARQVSRHLRNLCYGRKFREEFCLLTWVNAAALAIRELDAASLESTANVTDRSIEKNALTHFEAGDRPG